MSASIKKVLFLNISVLIIAFLIITGCQQKSNTSKELKPLAYKYVEVWNGGNLGELDAIIDLNYVYHSNQLPDVKGIDGLKKVITGFRTAFPDMKLVLEDEIYSENEAACIWRLTGTNTGPGAMHPTGKSIKIWGTSVFHFANGKFTGEWISFDNLSLLAQLRSKMKTSSKKLK
jgi:predicted ester cyclase